MIKEETGVALQDYAIVAKDREVSRKRRVLAAKISSLQTEFESVEEELNKIHLQEELKKQVMDKTRQEITRIRKGETDARSITRKK